jgi:chromosome segregation ATPase
LDVVTLKKDIGTLRQEKANALEKVNELTSKNKDIENNHQILTNLYEEQREQIAKLLSNCRIQSEKML